jgi:hypothetical protein
MADADHDIISTNADQGDAGDKPADLKRALSAVPRPST